jgi:hypothetical protein
MHQCLTIAATAYRAARISLPSICWNGARTCSSGTSRPYVKRCGVLGPSAHFTSTAGWFCQITSIACSSCHPVTMTFPTASKPSRSGAGGGTERATLIGAYSPRRTGDMATSFLGTRPSRRRRLCAPHGLGTLQSSQTWPCYGSGAMALFDVSPMGESRSLSCRVGWRRCYGRPRWRAYLIIRERLSRAKQMPSLAQIIREKADQLCLGASWTLTRFPQIFETIPIL